MGRQKKKLLYFAYCVNMVSSRMEYCVDKDATSLGPAKLCGYRLVFADSYSTEWKGCLPTVVRASGEDAVTWGVLWELDPGRLDRLDLLQGERYERVKVRVKALRQGAAAVPALTYRLRKGSYRTAGEDTRPSKLYLEEMLRGAEESGLPSYYRKWMRMHRWVPTDSVKCWSGLCLTSSPYVVRTNGRQ